MRGQVIRMLRPLDAVSVENSAYPGTPDVNFTEGWLELKWARDWPKSSDTIVPCEHFTPQQRVWLLRRHRAGGNVLLLWCVHKQWMLFDGQTAANVVGRCTRPHLEAEALFAWTGGINANELIFILTRKGNSAIVTGN